MAGAAGGGADFGSAGFGAGFAGAVDGGVGAAAGVGGAARRLMEKARIERMADALRMAAQ